MAVFTVHEPRLRSGDATPDAERFVFVRDGFLFWAFLLTPVWMLRHRMWLVLAAYVFTTALVEAALITLGASSATLAIVVFLISLLIGLESSTLRRFTLWRRGWKNAGIVSGDDVEDAERRFFDAWLRKSPSPRAAATGAAALSPVPAAGSPLAMPRATHEPNVIGLFPDPGSIR